VVELNVVKLAHGWLNWPTFDLNFRKLSDENGKSNRATVLVLINTVLILYCGNVSEHKYWKHQDSRQDLIEEKY
jgi:hypothetical protein